jgi:hypothetical protein
MAGFVSWNQLLGSAFRADGNRVSAQRASALPHEAAGVLKFVG